MSAPPAPLHMLFGAVRQTKLHMALIQHGDQDWVCDLLKPGSPAVPPYASGRAKHPDDAILEALDNVKKRVPRGGAKAAEKPPADETDLMDMVGL